MGSKLGGIRGGRPWTAADADGPGTLPFRRVWTDGGTRGPLLEIYGSGGWGFESRRACCRNPLQ